MLALVCFLAAVDPSAAAAAPAPAVQETPATTAPPKPKPAPRAKPRVLVLETQASGAGNDAVKGFGELLANLLEQRTSAVEIVPASSVRDKLAVTSDKVEAGCDDAACMSEMAGALDAQYVISSRAAQVGGRWSIRVELFDSTTLKNIAAATGESDSLEGIAAQADVVANTLIARAPRVLHGKVLPPPDKPGRGPWPWLVAGSGALLAAGGVTAWGVSYANANAEQTKLQTALHAFQQDPSSAANRKALADAGKRATDAGNSANEIFLPIGCASLPIFGAVSVGGLCWGLWPDGSSE